MIHLTEASSAEETAAQSRVMLALPTEVPAIVANAHGGPRSARLRRRANVFFLFLWTIGALPSVLSHTGVVAVNPSLEVFGWGLWLPGAGFVAVGGWLTLLFPVVLGLFSISMMVWAMSGMLVAPVLVWLLAAIAAACLAGTHVASYAPIVVPFATLAFVFKKYWDEFRRTKAETRRGIERMEYLDKAVASLEDVAKNAQLSADRELSVDEIKALRYMLNLSLQPVGQFAGFTKKDNIQLAALRYQLNYISYGLAALQCKYAPNFHGYLNRAQRFAIESLTDPKVCGYWKLESIWGKLKWNPDPIGTIDNIMLTGWSLIGISTYAANTGDMRYQERGVLKFKPFKKRSITFSHDVHSFVESLMRNWNYCSLYLYPCEPFWSFPLCNSLAFCGVVPYDRVNGTSFAASVRENFLRSFEEEFLLSDGNPKAVVSTLTGYGSLSRTNAQVELLFLLALATYVNAIHPGYARRWYALVRAEFLELVNGELSLNGVKWEECFDTGNYQKNPGFVLGGIALAAREHGDDEMAEAALRKADQLMARVDDPSVYAFEGISAAANLNIATARWSRKSDWQDLINVGPNREALKGPILTDCAYPRVLVAKAVSDGSGLDLVLYNGEDEGVETIKIERLTPGMRYEVIGAIESECESDSAGVAELQVHLKGRTPVTLKLA
ncbi:hypothetical protein G3O06_35820 [Burkholderia sp. Ac-20345]|uniref:linalool dehydratase/isomerase domain-containing protein n=1 Tax=Burkholderia sp. Ac-20345 TaxID=2703891 RepID=UPI00197B7DFD|nr:hypothetical protein [Burkholderia sp. Ac-20345]MBN3782863.1 hypothetical protein [Burkholderia sp. Ac-20345]